jgi:hypothetical protein
VADVERRVALGCVANFRGLSADVDRRVADVRFSEPELDGRVPKVQDRAPARHAARDRLGLGLAHLGLAG